jgi:GntR family transcriptional regulator
VPLFFRIQPSAPEPAYRQIVGAVQAAVRDGKLREGERLPSIRTLAADLAINPNTVARAYRELEWLGLVTSRLGSGFEVRRGEAGAAEVREKLASAVGEAVKALGETETMRAVREAMRDVKSRTGEAIHGQKK